MTAPPPGGSPAHLRLTGHGLILREWADDDLPAMVQLFDEPEVDRWTPLRAPFDLAAARAYLDRARDRRAGDGRIQLAVTTDGSTPLGEILLARDGADRTAELAYAIGARYRRQHLAVRAVRVITGYAYRCLGMEHVLLRVPAENVASSAVARAAGFELDGTGPITRDGVRHELLTWRHRAAPGSTGTSGVTGTPARTRSYRPR